MHVVSFPAAFFRIARHPPRDLTPKACLLYTSDAADE